MAEYGLVLFLDARMLTEKEVSTMASGFATRTQGNDIFHFDTRMTKSLKSLVHWVQDFYRTSEEPKIKGMNQIVFLSQLERSLSRN